MSSPPAPPPAPAPRCEVWMATFELMLGASDQFLKDYALFHSAELYEKLEQPSQARDRYQQLIDEFPRSSLKAKAEERLGQVEG